MQSARTVLESQLFDALGALTAESTSTVDPARLAHLFDVQVARDRKSVV